MSKRSKIKKQSYKKDSNDIMDIVKLGATATIGIGALGAISKALHD